MGFLPIIGMGISALSALSTAGSQSDSQNAAGAADTYNSTIMRQNAQMTLEQTNAQEETQRRKAGAQIGNQRAAIAQSGFDPASGSMADIYDSSVLNRELDSLNIRYQGGLKARGFKAQADLLDYSAKVHDMNADNAMIGGGLSAAGALFSGIGSMAKTNAGGGNLGGYAGMFS